MSSAAVQSSAAAAPSPSSRQYQASPHTRDQHYIQQSPAAVAAPQSSRKHSSRPSNGVSPQTPTQHHHSPSDSNASSITPRAHPASIPSTSGPPPVADSSSAGPSQQGPPIQPPPRTSSQHHRTNTATAPAMDNRSPTTGSSPRTNAVYTEFPDHPDPSSSSSSRRRTQQPPRDATAREGTSSRGKPSPGHSRSATQVGQTPVGTDLPREESTIINRLVASDPQEDIARERARAAESRGIPPGVDMTPITGLSLVGSESVDDVARRSQKNRSSEKSERSRKEILFGEYVLGQTLGEGEFGKVKMGWKKSGGVQVAIKLIKRETVAENPNRLPKIYREIAILRGLQHPNIVRLHEMVETERHIGIILEYASGGELFDYILQHRFLKDGAARRLFAQLVSGVGYLHKKGIVHRDLKLENLLLDRNRNIIITDFGFANTFNPNDELDTDIEYRLGDRDYVKKLGLEHVGSDGHRRGDLMQTSCGSPCYAAPELVVSDTLYTGRKVDVWSCGVILYAMLAGYLPFDDDPANPEGDNINLLYKYIVSTPLTFPEYVTPHARDLLKRILVPDPRKRADLFEVARHSWLSEYANVVGFITSSTTTETDITNTTVPAEDPNDTPLLARSASVREPSKSHAAVPPVGGLVQKTGQVDQPSDKSKTPRDVKRRTVQVEYVAPQSSTARGDSSSASRSRARSHSQGAAEKTPPVPPKVYDQAGPNTVQASPLSAMPPPTRPARDQQRAASESVTQAGLGTPPAQRPPTQGSITGSTRLPSRGNSYGQPAVSVTQEQAQGRFSQPKKQQYTISTPNRQEQALMTSSPSAYADTTTAARGPYTPQSQHMRRESYQPKGHKRSNTIGERIGSMFGRNAASSEQKQAEKAERERAKRHPPMAMKQPFVAGNDTSEPRMSSESRRTSFSFGRKNTDQSASQPPTQTPNQRSTRRFSLLPSLRGFGSKESQQQTPGSPASEQRRAVSQPRPRQDSRTRMTPKTDSRTPSQSTTNSNIPNHFEDRVRDPPNYRPVISAPMSAPAAQLQFSSNPYTAHGPGPQAYQNGYSRRDPAVDSSQTSIPHSYSQSQQQQDLPYRPGQYPHGFNDFDEVPARKQSGRLQKHKRFTDAYDDERVGGGTGAPRRVMDFFRRMGSRRQQADDR